MVFVVFSHASCEYVCVIRAKSNNRYRNICVRERYTFENMMMTEIIYLLYYECIQIRCQLLFDAKSKVRNTHTKSATIVAQEFGSESFFFGIFIYIFFSLKEITSLTLIDTIVIKFTKKKCFRFNWNSIFISLVRVAVSNDAGARGTSKNFDSLLLLFVCQLLLHRNN